MHISVTDWYYYSIVQCFDLFAAPSSDKTSPSDVHIHNIALQSAFGIYHLDVIELLNICQVPVAVNGSEEQNSKLNTNKHVKYTKRK